MKSKQRSDGRLNILSITQALKAKWYKTISGAQGHEGRSSSFVFDELWHVLSESIRDKVAAYVGR